MKHISLLFIFAITGCIARAEVPGALPSQGAIHQQVLALKPIGYWPADEGTGSVLHDLSGNDYHGKLTNVRWRNGLLEMVASAPQSIEIPSPGKKLKAYSFGCAIYNRADGYIRGGALVFGSKKEGQMGYVRDGAVGLILRGTFRSNDPSAVRGGLPSATAEELGETLINVTAGYQRDAIGTLAAGIRADRGQWQHLLYTYEPGDGTEVTKIAGSHGTRKDTYNGGVGRLYVNGLLVHTAQGVPVGTFDGGLAALRGFDGSGRDMVLFDRALSSQEARRLVTGSRPATEPVNETLDEPYQSLFQNLNSWQTRVEAAGILVRLEDTKIRAKLLSTLLRLVRNVEDATGSKEERATAVLALLEVHSYFTPIKASGVDFFGNSALYGGVGVKSLGGWGLFRAAVPVFSNALETILQEEGERVPRIDDLLRNSLIRALLVLEPQNPRVRELLGRALAKPIFDSLDLSKAHFAEIRPLVEQGQFMEALNRYRNHLVNEVPPITNDDTWVSWAQRPSALFLDRLSMLRPEHEEVYLSQGNPWLDARTELNHRAYTGVARRNGTTFFVEVIKLSSEEVARLDLSTAKDGRIGDMGQVTPQWARLNLITVDPSGQRQTTTLGGDEFIFDLRDGKISAWSLGVDQDGYVHLIGGMHNRPEPKNYHPKSWAVFGLSTNPSDETYPVIMYWVSKRPGDVTEMEFKGSDGNPRNIPTPPQFQVFKGGINYINFVNNRKTGTLFCYGRVYWQSVHGGRQSFGMYRYDTKTKRWSAIGGNPIDMIKDCDKEYPGWSNWLVHDSKSDKPAKANIRLLAWAWQTGFYNYQRGVGATFDRTGRMHTRMPLGYMNERGENFIMRKGGMYYAYSDDEGDTWHRANGSTVELPLTLNPSPKHNADMKKDGTQMWWDLWGSLLAEAGYSIEAPTNPK
jgi:hypothetical protein